MILKKNDENYCKTKCYRCGICCVWKRIEDFTLQFYKPSFSKCPYMQYENGITICKVYGTDKMPLQCKESNWLKVSSSCLSGYKYKDNMDHLMWAKKHGHLDKLKIIKDIKQKKYTSLKFIIQTFISPFLKHIPETEATSNTWLETWDIEDYLNQIPSTKYNILLEYVNKICNKIYNNKLPVHIQKLLLVIEQPITQWLKNIKFTMWG